MSDRGSHCGGGDAHLSLREGRCRVASPATTRSPTITTAPASVLFRLLLCLGARRWACGQLALGSAEAVGAWKPPRVNGGRQTLVRLSGESPSISRQIRAPAASTSAPSATQTEVIAWEQRS